MRNVRGGIVAGLDPLMITSICFTLSAVCSARSDTSCATTANPRPASPARAASMEAFSASRFVWSEMPLIISMIELRRPFVYSGRGIEYRSCWPGGDPGNAKKPCQRDESHLDGFLYRNILRHDVWRPFYLVHSLCVMRFAGMSSDGRGVHFEPSLTARRKMVSYQQRYSK